MSYIPFNCVDQAIRLIRDQLGEPRYKFYKKAEHSIPIRPGNGVISIKITTTRSVPKSIMAEVPESMSNAMLGLSNLDSLPDDYGMLFPSPKGLWMPGVKFPLDVGFIGAGGIIEEIMRMSMSPPGSLCPVYRPKQRCLLALEVPADFFNQHSIEPGCRVELDESENSCGCSESDSGDEGDDESEDSKDAKK